MDKPISEVETVKEDFAQYIEFLPEGYCTMCDRATGIRNDEEESKDKYFWFCEHCEDASEIINLKESFVRDIQATREEMKKDKERLDFLDRCNANLNEFYGTNYNWELILNHNVNRLMLDNMVVDLNDSAVNGSVSCREAIDKAMAKYSPQQKEEI
jgi:hypothetical protein